MTPVNYEMVSNNDSVLPQGWEIGEMTEWRNWFSSPHSWLYPTGHATLSESICCLLPKSMGVYKSLIEKLLGESRPLRWRHKELDGVSNHQPRHCLLKRLFRLRSKKTSKLRVTGLCAGNSPVRWPVKSPHKWPATWKMFPFDDIIMLGGCCNIRHHSETHLQLVTGISRNFLCP